MGAFLYRLALGLSLLYVLLLLLSRHRKIPARTAGISSLWLAAVQGLVTGVMGAFFVRQDSK